MQSQPGSSNMRRADAARYIRETLQHPLRPRYAGQIRPAEGGTALRSARQERCPIYSRDDLDAWAKSASRQASSHSTSEFKDNEA